MIIYDVLSELKNKNQYISSPVFAGKLSRPSVVIPVIMDAVERTKETGIMWQLTTAQIGDLFKVGDPYSLYATLDILERNGILSKAKDGRETVYSPIIEDRSSLRVVNTAIREVAKFTLMQSPRAIVTRTECDAISRENNIECGTKGYTLLAYDYDAFTGKSRDLKLLAYHTEDRMDPSLILTWFAIQGIKNIPRELEISNADDFWRIATRDFFVDHGAFNPVALPPVPWRSLAPKLVHPSTSAELRTSMIHKAMAKITADPITYQQVWEGDLVKFAPWPAEKTIRKPATVDEKPQTVLQKLDDFRPPKENPFEKPEVQAELAAKRMLECQERMRGSGSVATPKLVEKVVTHTRIINHDKTPEPKVTINESAPMTQTIKIPESVIQGPKTEAAPAPKTENTPAPKSEAAPANKPIKEQLRDKLARSQKIAYASNVQREATPAIATTKAASADPVRKEVDVTNSYEVMNDIGRSNLDPKVKNLVIQFLIKGGLNEPTI